MVKLEFYDISRVSGVRPMTAGRRRPPQDTISSAILVTTKVQAAINHDIINAKLSRVYIKFNFDVFNFT